MFFGNYLKLSIYTVFTQFIVACWHSLYLCHKLEVPFLSCLQTVIRICFNLTLAQIFMKILSLLLKLFLRMSYICKGVTECKE